MPTDPSDNLDPLGDVFGPLERAVHATASCQRCAKPLALLSRVHVWRAGATSNGGSWSASSVICPSCDLALQVFLEPSAMRQ